MKRGRLRVLLGAAPGVGKTYPDRVLRGADQIEVVDLAPQALRDRPPEGNVSRSRTPPEVA